MAVATFCKDLKIFSVEDDYSTPSTVSLSSNEKNGRITWSGDGKWLSVAPLEDGGGPLPIVKYSDKQLQPLKYVTLANISSASFFNWTNRNIAVGKDNGEVFIWDIKEKKIAVKVEYVEKQPVDFVSLNAEDAYLASGSLVSNKICIHGLKTNKVVNTLSIPKSSHTSSLKFCMCKKNFLGLSSIESTICVWDIMRSDFVFKMVDCHAGACTDISFSPINFNVIASVSLTKTLRMYDLRERKLILDSNVGEPLNCVDITLNGDKVALGTTGGRVIIYDLKADRILRSFKAHDGPVFSIKTQNLKIPKAYQEVEMNTPDTIDNPSKTLDISVMDIFSPICSNKEGSSVNFNQNKTVSFHSTPKFIIHHSESHNSYEDSFLRKVLSPLPSHNLKPSSQSSPYLCPISEKSDCPVEQNEPAVPLKESPGESLTNTPMGDGFHIDNPAERNVYYSDIISEIRNGLKEVLNEMSIIRQEMNQMKVDFDNRLKTVEERYEANRLVLGDIKQEIYAGNCDSKLEHISHRILMNELNNSILDATEKVNEQVKMNCYRLQHMYEIINGKK